MENFLPLVTALFAGYVNNVLPDSPRPGSFNPKEIRRIARGVSLSLNELSPRGDVESGKKMSEKFSNYIDNFIEIGEKVSVRVSREKLKQRFGL